MVSAVLPPPSVTDNSVTMSAPSTTQQIDPLLPLASKTLAGPSVFRDEVARRKSSSKSRNGCVTCKARRVKCDETKPSCNQCARRHVKCGGYRKEIRFRPVERPLAARAQPQPTRTSPPDTYEGQGDENTWCLRGGDKSARPSENIPSAQSSWPWLDADAPDFSFADFENEQSLWDSLTHADNCAQDGGGHTAQDDFGDPFDLNLDAFIFSLPTSLPSQPVSPLSFSQHEASEPEADSPEGVALLFHQQTCHVLSIYEDSSKNPWRTLVWPMVKDSKALYHAIAAMVYLRQSKSDPFIREKGRAHVQKSTQALETELKGGRIQMDAALAASIALAFAEAWDYQKLPSTGRDHIKGARILLQQSLSNHAFSQSDLDASPRLKFLTSTWIYMDVIARLTSDCGSPLSPELLSVFGSHSPSSNTNELDPLMGYAATLFPVIGRVGDLVSQVRARNSRRNSPAIISKAIELWKVIEKWTPSIDLELVEDYTPNMSDAIQTAEAYRWSTLLFLHQAVPELPNMASWGELGQKALVYLATIPISSKTTIVHTYPLMVAGTEAMEEEDREFVRERWAAMSKRMICGIVDRCLEVTEEVWRRRDTYLADHWPVSPNEAAGTQTWPSNQLSKSPTRESSENTSRGSPPQAPVTRKFPMGDFPISAAFKKGVDPLTRSGNTEFTVKGNLHWLGVMKDWRWEVMLG